MIFFGIDFIFNSIFIPKSYLFLLNVTLKKPFISIIIGLIIDNIIYHTIYLNTLIIILLILINKLFKINSFFKYYLINMFNLITYYFLINYLFNSFNLNFFLIILILNSFFWTICYILKEQDILLIGDNHGRYRNYFKKKQKGRKKTL